MGYPLILCCMSKCYPNLKAYTPIVGVRIVEVVEAAHIVYLRKFENVAYADTAFNVWAFVIHADSILLVCAIGKEMPREIEKVFVAVIG